MSQIFRVCGWSFIGRNKVYNAVRSVSTEIFNEPKIMFQSAAEKWADAKPSCSIPGPTKFQFIRAFLPGGYLYKKSLLEMHDVLRKKYGDIYRFPGTFGKRDIICSFNPEDYHLVFRTEGQYPMRRGLDIIVYYRKVHNPEPYSHKGGLVAGQGEDWGSARSIVNPVMMSPKTTKLYIPKMNKVADELVLRICELRDPRTKEVPPDFEKELNHWSMDAVGLVALDVDLGMIKNGSNNPELRSIIDNMKIFFQLLLELDILPSLWKYISTPKFKKFMNALDQVTTFATLYIDRAIERFEKEKSKGVSTKPEHERGVLERLIEIDRSVAVVMAMDTLMAGVDTTTSALTACLLCLAKYPEKQQKLRDEIKNLLPTKNTALTAENMKEMPYLRACIKEALRIFPVTSSNFRATGQDVVLSGYRVPKETDIAMPWQLLTQDEKYFENPTQFIPERWLRDARKNKKDTCPAQRSDPFVFLPFGFGPRTCVGKRIVDLELETVLAKLVRNFEIRFDYSMDNIFKVTVINTPAKPLQFKFIDVEA